MISFPADVSPRLWTLANRMCEGTIDEHETQELGSLLEADANGRDFYVDFLKVNSELSWLISAKQHSTMDLGPRLSVDALTPPPSHSPFLDFLGDWTSFFNQHLPLTFTVLFGMFGALILATWLLAGSSRHANVPVESEFVAQLTVSKDCQWSPTMPQPTEQMQLEAGRNLLLDKGIAQITYYSGAVVLVEGPASFTVDSPKSGLLVRGRLTVRAATERSRQFAIVTPYARFVDLGTEFGVRIDDKGRSEVAVFSGKVNAEAKLPNSKWDTPLVVSAGEAVVCEGGKFASFVTQRSSFPSLQPLPPPPPMPDPSFQRWLDASRELQKNPDLLAYYDFQPDQGDINVLKNRAPTGAALNGEILEAPWVEGRFPGKSALDFTADGAGARINIPSDQRQLTLIAWLFGDHLANDYNGILMSDNWKEAKQLHWEILKSGQVYVGVWGQSASRVSDRTIPADSLRQWFMLAAVIDTDASLHRLYLNGELFDEFVSRENMPPAPPNIGSATIGGWNNQGRGGSPRGKVHNLSGRMDELMIFQKTLSADEIKQIYEAGKP